jgi:hypothetical protein
VRLVSPDFANLGVGGPGNAASRHITTRWFQYLSMMYNLPLIPVFNSANKSGTLVDVVQNQAGAAVNVGVILGQLAPGLPQVGSARAA